MGRRSPYREVDEIGYRTGQQQQKQHRRAGSRDWDATSAKDAYSLPRRPRAEVQRRESRSSESRRSSRVSRDQVDVNLPPRMPPPPHLVPSPAAAAASHRLMRESVVYASDEGDLSSGHRRRGRRDESPPREYSRRHSRARHSRHSPEGSPEDDRNGDDGEVDEDNIIEVVEDSDGDDDDEEPPPRERKQHRSREDTYHTSQEDRRRRRRDRERGRDSTSGSDEKHRMPPRESVSDHDSPVRSRATPQRRRGADESPRSRQRPVADVIEDTRPPVSSKRPLQRAYTTTQVVYEEDRPRRSRSVTSSSRGRARSSSSRRPSSIIGSIFGPSQTSPEKPAKLVECVVCMEEVPTNKAAKLKCGHRMCHKCLQRSFKLSIKDPQHMPPKCCTAEHIPLKHVDRLFDVNFKRTWNRKFAEYSTRNRIYCPSKKCGEWIRPSNIRREDGRKVARCGACKTKVCPTCNNKWHRSSECPKDEETNQFLEQAKEAGWQRCYRCKAMVELKEGCNHMTCRCGAQFCMICGVRWKSCECPWFNYEAVEADRLAHMNVPVPAIRGDLADVFVEDGPPVPPELREHIAAEPVPSRQRPPHTYNEEMARRQLQEQGDLEYARLVQVSGDDISNHGATGFNGWAEIVDVGNSAGHFMNDHYNRHAGHPTATGHSRRASAAYDVRGVDYVTDMNRARGVRGGSMERRLADRLSDRRAGAMRASLGADGMAPPAMTRRHTTEEDLYHMSMPSRRSPPATSRRAGEYEDLREYRERDGRRGSTRNRRRTHGGSPPGAAPKGSTMAGLNSAGSGMNRVFEWRNFVEPGVPDGESTISV